MPLVWITKAGMTANKRSIKKIVPLRVLTCAWILQAGFPSFQFLRILEHGEFLNLHEASFLVHMPM